MSQTSPHMMTLSWQSHFHWPMGFSKSLKAQGPKGLVPRWINTCIGIAMNKNLLVRFCSLSGTKYVTSLKVSSNQQQSILKILTFSYVLNYIIIKYYKHTHVTHVICHYLMLPAFFVMFCVSCSPAGYHRPAAVFCEAAPTGSAVSSLFAAAAPVAQAMLAGKGRHWSWSSLLVIFNSLVINYYILLYTFVIESLLSKWCKITYKPAKK